jgi:hypothetical protein
MSLTALRSLFAAYAAFVLALLLGVRAWASLGDVAPEQAVVVESAWRGGERVARRVRRRGEGERTEGDAGNERDTAGATIVLERVALRGPLPKRDPFFGLALVAGKDGVAATLDGRTVYATVDDLLHAQAYDHGASFLDPSLTLGTHRATVVHLLATELGTSAADVEARATFERVRFERTVPSVPDAPRVTKDTLSFELVLAGVREAAHHLARIVDDEGSFRYLVDAPTDKTIPGYNWPRHAGATFFLAQAAALLDDPVVRYAALRAAARMRDDQLASCGAQRCITDWEQADVGSSALGLIAFTELVRTGADRSYVPAIRALAGFLRAQQRPDGELMHMFDRRTGKPVDVQYLYFTGEAALALARAHHVTGDPRDLDAARRALAYLAREGWSFFGSRYYWSEEHWTCQAVDELWERAPDPVARAFCSEWHVYQRALQQRYGDSPFDGDGSFGFGPVVTPRLTPAASRGEAAGALLAVVRRSGGGRADAAGSTESTESAESAALDDELSRAVAFLLRHQLVPERAPMHLFAAPERVRGAMPGSAVDDQLRIDYAQHAGSAMIRWLALHDAARAR